MKLLYKYLLGILLIGVLVWGYLHTHNENVLLKKNGVFTKGVIYEVGKGRKGRCSFKYRYQHNGYSNEGSSTSARRFNVGDTIGIFYLPNDPEINKPVFNVN